MLHFVAVPGCEQSADNIGNNEGVLRVTENLLICDQREVFKTERGSGGPIAWPSQLGSTLLEREDLGTSLLLCPCKMFSQGS
jgi:hypothetical protein